MRYAAFLLLPFALSAQPATTDQRLTEALVTEIQQLRLAIERSTLLAARSQLAISQLQLQETTVTRLTQQYNDERSAGLSLTIRRNESDEHIKDLEQRMMQPELAGQRADLQVALKQNKIELESAAAMEQQHSTREADLAMQLREAQNRLSESRKSITEMERALDAAIQQMLKTK